MKARGAVRTENALGMVANGLWNLPRISLCARDMPRAVIATYCDGRKCEKKNCADLR